MNIYYKYIYQRFTKSIVCVFIDKSRIVKSVRRNTWVVIKEVQELVNIFRCYELDYAPICR